VIKKAQLDAMSMEALATFHDVRKTLAVNLNDATAVRHQTRQRDLPRADVPT